MPSSSALFWAETPPLTRGRLRGTFFRKRIDGNTPAYAGKTMRSMMLDAYIEKHPRLRGEDAKSTVLPKAMTETPPLTRGRLWLTFPQARPCEKHPRLRGEDFRGGERGCEGVETPPLTRGRPSLASEGPWRRKKHPRLRGEDQRRPRRTPLESETPPLTRGRLEEFFGSRGIVRNTPAYAGKTACGFQSAGSAGKHPRLRGEDPPAPAREV